MSQDIRKSVRDKLLTGKKNGGRKFTLDDMELFFSFPTRRDKREIIAKSTENGQVNNALLEVYTAIQLTKIAETGEKVFTDEDFDVIDGLETGGEFDEVCAEALLALLGAETDPK